jgi:glycosyltransferase involved in cell wall biosynthesis/Tfp pilus assembly protein PilF
MGLFFWRKSKTQVSGRVIIDLSSGATLADDYHLPEPFENKSMLEKQHPVELIKKAYNTKDWPTFYELAKARILIEQEREVHIYLIRAYYGNNEWTACVSICHLLLSFESNDIDAYRFIARCANNNLELETAIEYYLKIIEIVPFDSDSLISLIRIYYKMNNYNKVIEYAKTMTQEYPAVREGHIFLFRAFHSLQDFESAITPLEALLELNGNDLDALLPLIRIYYNMNNYNKVIEYAKTMTQEYPTVREGHLFMARSSMVLGKNQQSLKALLQLLVMDENDIEALVTIGKALHNLEQYNDAMGYFERALAIDPGERRSRRTLALIYDRLGKSEQALDLYTKECIFQPLAFSNWEKKINLLYRLNREQKALDCIPELLELGNSNLESYLLANEIALSFFWNKMSKDLLKHSYEKWGNDGDFFKKIALSSILSGNLSTASKYISEGLQKTTKRKELMELQKRLQQILDETNTPRKMLKEAISNGEIFFEIECHIMNLIKEASKIKPYSITEAKSNVLMISSSLGRGGAERQVVSSLQGLLKDPKFEETKLYCYSISGSRGQSETYESEVSNLGVRIHEFGKRIDWNAGIKDAEILLEPWKKYLEKLPVRMQRDIEPLFLNFHHERPQIVHAWQDQTNINASIAALMAGVPGIVMFARSMRPDGKTMMHIRNRPYLRSAYQTLFEHSPRVLLCHNSSAGARSYSQWIGCPEDDFEVIHNGVDFSGIEKASEGFSMSGILHIPKKSIVIGGVFRLVTEKRPKLWVEAISKVLDVKENVFAVHVGGGSHSEFIQDYVNDLGLGDKIHLIGQTKQIKAWLDEFDLFLLTSIVEGLPNVLIEAQAFGVPVVSTDAGGAKDTFIDGETGILVTEPTADELANAILKCLNDPEWMEIAKINSRINARKRFSQESMLKRLKEIYTFSLQRT